MQGQTHGKIAQVLRLFEILPQLRWSGVRLRWFPAGRGDVWTLLKEPTKDLVEVLPWFCLPSCPRATESPRRPTPSRPWTSADAREGGGQSTEPKGRQRTRKQSVYAGDARARRRRLCPQASLGQL